MTWMFKFLDFPNFPSNSDLALLNGSNHHYKAIKSQNTRNSSASVTSIESQTQELGTRYSAWKRIKSAFNKKKSSADTHEEIAKDKTTKKSFKKSFKVILPKLLKQKHNSVSVTYDENGDKDVDVLSSPNFETIQKHMLAHNIEDSFYTNNTTGNSFHTNDSYQFKDEFSFENFAEFGDENSEDEDATTNNTNHKIHCHSTGRFSQSVNEIVDNDFK